MRRRVFAASVLAALAAPARAQEWPGRQIKVVIPYPPGGPTDISARIVMEKAGQILGQPILFDNKGGALGHDRRRVRQDPAGRRLHLPRHHGGHARHHPPPAAHPDRPGQGFPHGGPHVDLLDGARHPPLVPAQTLQEFVAYAKANPGKVNFGSAGLGTITQLFGEMLNLEAGIKMVHVPYKGSAQATNDLLGGQIQAQFDRPCCRISRPAGCAGSPSWPTGAGRISPRSRPCASRATARTAATPGTACWRPPARRAPLVDKMAKAIGEALKSPDVIDRLDKGGAKVTYLGPAAMRAQVDAESKAFADIIRRGDVKAQ